MIRLKLWHLRKDDSRTRTSSFGTPETFGIYIKASLLVGVILSSPWILYQLWLFVGAGLYSHEKHYVKVYLPMSVALFLLGAAIAFFFVFGRVLDFLFLYQPLDGHQSRSPNQRMAELRDDPAARFRRRFPTPAGDVFPRTGGNFHGRRLSQAMETFRVGESSSSRRFSLRPIPYSMLFLAVPLVMLFFGGSIALQIHAEEKSAFETLDK